MAGEESWFGHLSDRQGSARKYVAFFRISQRKMDEGEEQKASNLGPEMVALCSLPCVRHKTINYYSLSSHHVFVTVKFGFRGVNRFYSYLLSFVNRASDSTGISGGARAS